MCCAAVDELRDFGCLIGYATGMAYTEDWLTTTLRHALASVLCVEPGEVINARPVAWEVTVRQEFPAADPVAGRGVVSRGIKTTKHTVRID